MFKAGTKFSNKPRSGDDYVYEIVGEHSLGFCFIIRNTSFPEYDDRGKEWLESIDVIKSGFINGDYIILK